MYTRFSHRMRHIPIRCITKSASGLRLPQPLIPPGERRRTLAREQNREAIFPSASCASKRSVLSHRECKAIPYETKKQPLEKHCPIHTFPAAAVLFLLFISVPSPGFRTPHQDFSVFFFSDSSRSSSFRSVPSKTKLCSFRPGSHIS